MYVHNSLTTTHDLKKFNKLESYNLVVVVVVVVVVLLLLIIIIKALYV